VHQGQDVLSPCGTQEVAAGGGRVAAAGYDPELYGYWLVIDGRGTDADYRYAHLEAPTPLHAGDSVRTGAAIGRVGRTGNARTVGCMLHFEEWPAGWLHGTPVDPLPNLLRWDGWS
jgi:murein DD-endopeptidase MepM/ murein hydrolase activator NlpD